MEFLEVNISIDDIKQDLLQIAQSSNEYKTGGYTMTVNERLLMNIALRSPGPQEYLPVPEPYESMLISRVNGLVPHEVIIHHCQPNFVITPHQDNEAVAGRKTCLTYALTNDVSTFAPTCFTMQIKI